MSGIQTLLLSVIVRYLIFPPMLLNCSLGRKRRVGRGRRGGVVEGCEDEVTCEGVGGVGGERTGEQAEEM